MKKEDLISILKERNVPEEIYSLDGIQNGECLCIVKKDGAWGVVYNSRGEITYEKYFETDEQAYDDFYEITKKSYRW